VGVVGIGRVGLPLAAVLSKHFDTVGVDVDPAVVDRVNSRSAFAEPKLADYISRYNLRASSDFSELEDCQVVFVCVGSQVPGKGYSSGRFLSALRETLPHITRKEQLLVISTTLPPLELKEEVIPLLASEKLEERAMGYCYNPAMVALGRAVSDFENPSFLMIGESNQDAGTGLESLWRTVVPQGIRVFRRRVIDIAVAKYALNVALVLKISLLSYLTEFCEKEESDIDVVTEILRAEPRVAGPKMFKGGLGYGGTCYPVDIEAARNEGERLGIPGFFPEALQELNDWQVERTVELVSRLGKKKVAVLGLSFKPDTDVVVGSQSMMIAEKLSRGGYDVMVFDPMAMNNAKAVLGGNVRYASSLKEAIEFGDVVFFGVEWPEFGRLGAKDFRKDQVVIDPWRLLRENPPPGRYVPYGTTA
jgi:UDPglucose 6-dehydrogenase